MGFLWGQVEIKRSILDKSTWRCLFDIQEEMWSRRLECRREVMAKIRSGRHQCADRQVLPLYMRIINRLFKSLYFYPNPRNIYLIGLGWGLR